jgi:hypothetical protein
MKNILALIGAALVLFVALGWYRGWYQLGTEPGKINVDVNTKKFVADEQKAVQKVSGVINNGTSGTDPAPGVVPTVPTQPQDKKVEAQPTGLQFNPDGSITIVSPYKNIGQ